jgi:hypothetical protein
MAEALAIVALAGVSALWVVVQRIAKRLDPADPGVRRGCGGCAQPCDDAAASGACRGERRPSRPAAAPPEGPR